MRCLRHGPCASSAQLMCMQFKHRLALLWDSTKNKYIASPSMQDGAPCEAWLLYRLLSDHSCLSLGFTVLNLGARLSSREAWCCRENSKPATHFLVVKLAVKLNCHFAVITGSNNSLATVHWQFKAKTIKKLHYCSLWTSESLLSPSQI